MADHHPPCPYEDKIVANPTTARVLLMFLRDFVESRTVYTPWPQSCFCPMMKCYQAFSDPLALIEHLLNCPELPRGEFECWKCENWHGFPTNEKDWAEWLGWKSQQANEFQRKRSFSFKVKEAMNPLRRRSSVVKAGPPQQQQPPPPPSRQQQQQSQQQQQQPPSSQAQQQRQQQQQCTKHHHHGSVMGGIPECQWDQISDPHLKRACPYDLRLDSQQCDLPFNFNGHHHHQQQQQHQQGGSPEQASMSAAFSSATTAVDDSKLGQIAVWPPDIDPDEMCDISTTPSAIFEPTGSSSTSRTSFFPNMTHEQFHQHLVHQLSQQQQFLLSPQLTECHPSSPLAAMAGSDAPPAPQPPVDVDDTNMFITSPVDVEPQRAGEGPPPPWWGPRPDDLLGVATSMAGQDPSAMGRVHMLQGGGVPRELSISTSSHPSFDLDQNQAQAYAQMPRVLPFHNCDNPHHRAAAAAAAAGLYPGATAADHQHQQQQQHHHHHHLHAALTPPNDASSFGSPASVLEPPPPQQKQSPATTDDTELVCDQCNWKPRGVTENLKGYLRKHKNTHKGLRYPCEFEGCTKTFGRPDNLKAHKRDKHGIDETANSMHDEAVHAHHAIKQQQQQQQQQQALVAQQQQQQQQHHVQQQQQHHVQQAHVQSDQQSQGEERAPRDSSELAFRGIRPEHAVLWGGLNL